MISRSPENVEKLDNFKTIHFLKCIGKLEKYCLYALNSFEV